MVDEKHDFPEFELNYSEMFRELRRRGRECLSLEELDDYLAGQLSGPTLEQADQHLRSCSMCAAELKQLSDFLNLKEADIVLDAEPWKRAKSALDLQLEELVKARRAQAEAPSLREKLASWWSGFWLLFAQPAYVRVASVLVVLLGLSLLFYHYAPHWKQQGFPGMDVERRVEQAGKIKVLRPMGKVSRSSLICEWQPVPEAKYYVVEIYTTGLETIWASGETFTNKVSLPQEIAAKLQAGRSYLWKVRAFDENKRAIKDSSLQSFAVAAQGF